MGTENIGLKLGDIIRLNSPGNDDYNNKPFLIEYISDEIIIMVDPNNKYELTIENGEFTDESIEGIDIISRSTRDGYIRQQYIETRDYISVYFSGKNPYVLNGIVTNIEEDMLEISRIDDNEKFYIDFQYHGVPRNLNIERIVVKENQPDDKRPEMSIDDGTIQDTSGKRGDDAGEVVGDDAGDDVGDDVGDKGYGESQDVSIDNDEDFRGHEEDAEKIDINELVKKSGVLMFGDMLDPVIQKFNVAEGETRYGIDIQTNDLFNSMKGNDDEKRNDKILKQIVHRFKELRSDFSIFNDDDNVAGLLKRDHTYKPIVEQIKSIENNISWLIPVVEQERYLYNLPEASQDEVDDIIVKGDLDHVKEIHKLKTPKDFKSTADMNGYYLYLQELHNFLMPYSNIESNNLYKINISKSSIDVMVDNDEKNGMSVYKDGTVDTQRYGVQRYLPPRTKNVFMDNKNPMLSYTKMVNHGLPEFIELKSFITLHKSAIIHEKINCGSTSIKDKCNISASTFIQSMLIKTDKNKEEHYITDFDMKNENKKKLFEMATNHILDVADTGVGVNKNSVYEKYFDYIFPSIKEMFHIYKSELKHVYNLNKIYQELEVFKIDKDHITFKQYENLFMFLNTQLLEFNSAKEKRKIEFGKYRQKIRKRAEIKTPSVIEQQMNSILDLPEDKLNIHEKMGLINKYNDLFHLYIDKKNMSLNSTKNINESLEYFIGKLDKIKDGTNDCDDDFVISNEYVSEDMVHADDGKDIYYNKKFDTTIYDLMEVYKTDQMTLEPTEFKKFLVNKLVSVNGLTEEKAEYDAETLINGKKKVLDGTYAILQEMDEVNENYNINYSFFKRIGDKWVLDSKKTAEYKDDGPIIMENGTEFICNMKKDCAKKDKTCEPISGISNQNKKDLVRRMMGEFEHRFYMERDDLNKLLDESILRGDNMRSRLDQLKELEQLKYVNYYNMVASGYVEQDTGDKSPYLDALEMIIGIDDFVLKQEQLLRFSPRFTREPTYKEDPYWRYCLETNTKLMPMFLHRLAHAFSVGNYIEVLNDIVKDQGRTSDDGDSIVDVHSGKRIKNRDLSGDDEYDDKGYRITKEQIKDDDNDREKEALEIQDELDLEGEVFNDMSGKNDNMRDVFDIKESTMNQMSREFVTIITKKMKININEKTLEFVIYHTINTYIRSFGNTVNNVSDKTRLLLITTSMLFLGIQLSSIRNNKSYPGCVVSFDGYPLFEEGGSDGIDYISCCISKISKEKRTSELFSIIKNETEGNIKKQINKIMSTLILTNTDIQLNIQEKRDMMMMNEAQVKITTPFVFLPSLYDSRMKIVKTLNTSFYDEMKSKISSKTDNVYVYINRLKSKNIEIGHAFVKIINDQLKKTDLLLTSFDEPYLENTCCLEPYETKNTLDYFNNIDGTLYKYSDMSRNNTELCDGFFHKYRSNVLATKRTQVSTVPFVQTHFDEKTIYTAFIHYCKWNKNRNMFSLKGDLYDICEISDDGLIQTNTIEEKIKILKASGKMLNNSMLMVLINKINKTNMIDIEPPIISQNSVDIFNLYLDASQQNSYISKITPVVKNLTNTFDISMKHNERTKESFQAVSFLEKETQVIQTNILKFIKGYSSLSGNDNKIITRFMNDFDKFEVDKKLMFDDNVFLNKLKSYKNMMYEISRVIPNIIINKILHYDGDESKYDLIPKYWKLSPTHVNDITNFNRKYYNWMSVFHDDGNLIDLFNSCDENNIFMYSLSKLTPIYTPKQDKTKLTHSLFDEVFSASLYKYYIFSMFDNYINVVNETLYDVENSILSKQSLSMYIKKCILHLAEMKNISNNNYDVVMKKILHYKEKEKLRITEKFELLSDQEREIENELKNNKLGSKWGKGLESGLVRYDPNVYESEREEIDIYALESEREQNDIGFLDDDDGATSYDEY